jgi:hypothetical protein
MSKNAFAPDRLMAALALGLFALGVGSCTQFEPGPRIWLDDPLPGTHLEIGAPVTIISNAFAQDGVAWVTLTVDGVFIRQDAPPDPDERLWECRQVWIPEAEGVYRLEVQAYDHSGVGSRPAQTTIIVGHVATPIPIFTLAPPTPVDTPTPVDVTPPADVTPPPPTPVVTAPPDDTFPPPAPSPLTPANGAELSCRAKQSLTWAPVTDPSGIAEYWVLLQYQVTPSEWTKGEILGPFTSEQAQVDVDCGRYYRWAVRAVDGAGNTGPLSTWFYFAIVLN